MLSIESIGGEVLFLGPLVFELSRLLFQILDSPIPAVVTRKRVGTKSDVSFEWGIPRFIYHFQPFNALHFA